MIRVVCIRGYRAALREAGAALGIAQWTQPPSDRALHNAAGIPSSTQAAAPDTLVPPATALATTPKPKETHVPPSGAAQVNSGAQQADLAAVSGETLAAEGVVGIPSHVATATTLTVSSAEARALIEDIRQNEFGIGELLPCMRLLVHGLCQSSAPAQGEASACVPHSFKSRLVWG